MCLNCWLSRVVVVISAAKQHCCLSMLCSVLKVEGFFLSYDFLGSHFLGVALGQV
jgi:hypothetical protein